MKYDILDVIEFIFDFICAILIVAVDCWVALVLVSFIMIMVTESFFVGLFLLFLLGFPLTYVIYRFNQVVFNSIF